MFIFKITHIGIKVGDKDPKVKVDDHLRLSKCKNIFAKGYCQNWQKTEG